MFEPQVTLKEMGTPDAMLRSPADAITTAVVNAAMLRVSLSRALPSCLGSSIRQMHEAPTPQRQSRAA
jgi:hypothetical protein